MSVFDANNLARLLHVTVSNVSLVECAKCANIPRSLREVLCSRKFALQITQSFDMVYEPLEPMLYNREA